MNNFNQLTSNVILISIFVVALILRIYNFPQRVLYGPEQARSLIVAGRYLTERPSLLGQEYFVRFTSQSHVLFASPVFNYFLVPLEIIFNHNIFYITFIFLLLNLITGLFIFLVSKKIFDIDTALFALFFFLFNSYMIYHSLFVWSYNLLPLIGILSMWGINSYYRKQQSRKILFLGLLSGLGFGIQYLYLPLVAIIFLILFNISRSVKTIIYFVLSFFIGILPIILFDLKHDFYHTRTLWIYFLDTLAGKSGATFSYYYLLPLWSFASIVGGYLLNKIYRKNKLLMGIILTTYLFVNLNSKLINFQKAVGMPKDLVVNDLSKASKIIANDNSTDFNVTTLIDFDTRGYVLRYPLESVYKLKPMGVEEYKNAKVIYVLSDKTYDYNNPKVWELQVFEPYNVQLLQEVNSRYAVYKLNKI